MLFILSDEGNLIGKIGNPPPQTSIFANPRSSCTDTNGNVYVAGGWFSVSVTKYSPQFNVIWTISCEQIPSANDMIRGNDGYIYIASTGDNKIYKCDTNGNVLASWGNSPGNNLFSHLAGIAMDSKSNIYAVDDYGEYVSKFTSSGGFIFKIGGLGSSVGKFYYPCSIAVDSHDDFYVMDLGNSRVQKFSESGAFISTWGQRGYAPSDLYQPNSIAIDHEDFVYVADGAHRIQKFNKNGEFVDSWGCAGQGLGQLDTPNDTAVDSKGNVYVADTENQRVEIYKPDGSWLYTIGNQGVLNDMPFSPVAVDVDRYDNLYVATAFSIFIFDPGHALLTSFGQYGTDEGQFNNISDIKVDGDGNIYVADRFNSRVQKLSPGGTFIASIGAAGSGPGELDRPSGLVFDSAGNIYVADEFHSRIAKFDGQGNYLSEWEYYMVNYNTKMFWPKSIAIGPDDSIYCVDFPNTIVKLTTEGETLDILCIIDSGTGDYVAYRGLEVDHRGVVFVADANHGRIVKYVPDIIIAPILSLLSEY
jgi:DNA-binding beta-propeller fold protein YncE